MCSQNLWLKQCISLRNDDVRSVIKLFIRKVNTHFLHIAVMVDSLNYKGRTLEECVLINNKVKNQRDRKHRMIRVSTIITLGNYSSNISMINYNKQSNIFRSN